MISSSMSRIVLATHNAGKLREFQGLMKPFQIEIDSAGALGLPEPEETGTTFEENAFIKARAAARAAGLTALSDDSGLCVDALDGAPGVYTADWAIQPDGSRNWQLAMAKVEDALQANGAKLPAQRKAKFVAVLCLCAPDGSAQYFRGEAPGTLVWPTRGADGFGYDPMFQPEGHARTSGEMNAEEKQGWKPGMETATSHRARAFQLFARQVLGAA